MKIDFTFDGTENEFLEFIKCDRIRNIVEVQKRLSETIGIEMNIESICSETGFKESNRLVIIAKSIK